MEGNSKSLNRKIQAARGEPRLRRDSRFKIQDKGQTLVELLLALGIFAFIMTAVFALVFGGLTTGLRTEEQDYATMYAQEGLDAARSIRDTDWNAFAQNGTHGVVNPGTGWSWSGTTFNEITYGARKFTREISVEDVYRKASGDIFTGSDTANFDFSASGDYQCEGGACPSANLKVADDTAKLNGSVRLDNSVNPKELTADANTKALYHFNLNEGKELALGDLGGASDVDLKSLWHLNENTGQTAVDSKGANNGTRGVTSGAEASDPAWTTAGKFSNALSFDGVDDYVDIANESNFNFSSGQSLTLEAWIYPTALVSGNSEIIIAKGVDGGRRHFFFDVVSTSNDSGKLRFLFHNTSGSAQVYEASSPLIIENNWQHVVFAYTFGTGSTAKLYINGAPATDSWIVGSGDSGPYASNETVKIGKETGSGSNEMFNGFIDEMAVYNTVLAPETIKEHYRRGVVEDYTNNDPNAFEANDGNTYGPISAASNTDLSEALSFDGVDDYVSAADSANFDLGSYTLEAWIKSSSTAAQQRIISHQDATQYWVMGLDAGRLRFCDNFELNCAFTIETVNDGAWHHVAVVRDIAINDKYKWYIDGALKKTITGTNTSVHNIAQVVNIGRYNDGAQSFSGSIDEVAVWNKALTQADIWDHIGANVGYQTNSYATVKYNPNPPGTPNKDTLYMDKFKEFVETATIPPGTSIDYQLSADDCTTMKYWDGDSWEAAGGWNNAQIINRYFDQLAPSSTICLSARLNTTDTNQTPVLDNVEIKYSQNRDAAATLDTHTKRVTSRVKWPSGFSFQDLELTEYLNDWNYNSWTETTYNDFASGTKPPSLMIKDAANPDDANAGLITPVLQTFQTADTDFNNGTFINTIVSGSGPGAKVVLSPGLAPYSASGTFESATIDLGSADFGLDTISWDAIVPGQSNGAGMEIPATTPGLVGLWHMDSGFSAANDVLDSGANNLHGTAGDGAALSLATKKIGAGAGVFTADTGAGGGPSYVEVDYDPALNITTAISVEAWIYVNSFPDTTTNYSDIVRKGFSTFQYILRTGDSTGGSNSKKASFQICKSSSPCVSGDDAWVNSPFSAELATGKWHHLVGLYDGSFVRLYVNGIEQGPLLSQNYFSGFIKAGGDVLAIGSGSLSWNDFDGYIDEVAIYSRALSAEEIRMHYASFKLQMAASTDGVNWDPADLDGDLDTAEKMFVGPDGTANTHFIQPVGLWHFNEATSGVVPTSANYVLDSSGNGNNGTYMGTPGAVYTNGKLGGAIQLDGIDDNINIPSSTMFDFSANGSFSYFMWFNKNTPCTSVEGNEVFANRSGTDDLTKTWWFGCGYSQGPSPNTLVVNVWHDSGNSIVLSSASTINDGEWHHGGWIYDGSANQVRLYLDGALQGTANTTFTGDFNIANPLLIGRYQLGDYYADGFFDEISIYDRALTQAEILARYNSGAGYEGAVRTLASAGLNGKQYLRYKAYFGTVDTAYTPQLDDVLINSYSTLPPPYIFESQVYNANGLAKLYSGNWNGSQPASSALSLEARIGNVDPPDGTWTNWAPIGSGASGSFSNLSGLNNKQYFQYRANFTPGTIGDTNTYPKLFDVNSVFKGSY